MGAVMVGCLLDGIEIEAMVQQEALVFAGHDSHRHVGRHLGQGYPGVMATEIAILNAAYHHQGGDIDREEAVGYYRQYR